MWAGSEGCDSQTPPGTRGGRAGAGARTAAWASEWGWQNSIATRDLWPPEGVHIILRQPLSFPGSGTVGKDACVLTSCLPLRLIRQISLLSIPRGKGTLFLCLTHVGHFASRDLCLRWLIRSLLPKVPHWLEPSRWTETGTGKRNLHGNPREGEQAELGEQVAGGDKHSTTWAIKLI